MKESATERLERFKDELFEAEVEIVNAEALMDFLERGVIYDKSVNDIDRLTNQIEEIKKELENEEFLMEVENEMNRDYPERKRP